MKQAYILLLGFSLPISAMETTTVNPEKQEEVAIEMKQLEVKKPTVVVIPNTKQPPVGVFMKSHGLAEALAKQGDLYQVVSDELENMSVERYNKLVAGINTDKPVDPKSYILARTMRAMRNNGLTLLHQYRVIAAVGWGLTVLGVLTYAATALGVAAENA